MVGKFDLRITSHIACETQFVALVPKKLVFHNFVILSVAASFGQLQGCPLNFQIYFVLKHTSGSALRLPHMARTISMLFRTITSNFLTRYHSIHSRTMIAASFGQLQGFSLNFQIYFVIKHTSGSAHRLTHMSRTDSALFRKIPRYSFTRYRYNPFRAMTAARCGQLQGFLLNFQIYLVIKHTSGSALRLTHMARTISMFFRTITSNFLTRYHSNHFRTMIH